MKHELLAGSRPGAVKYPWADMRIGDYFEVPLDYVTDGNIRMQAYFRKKKTGEEYRVTKDLSAFRVTRRK